MNKKQNADPIRKITHTQTNTYGDEENVEITNDNNNTKVKINQAPIKKKKSVSFAEEPIVHHYEPSQPVLPSEEKEEIIEQPRPEVEQLELLPSLEEVNFDHKYLEIESEEEEILKQEEESVQNENEDLVNERSESQSNESSDDIPTVKKVDRKRREAIFNLEEQPEFKKLHERSESQSNESSDDLPTVKKVDRKRREAILNLEEQPEFKKLQEQIKSTQSSTEFERQDAKSDLSKSEDSEEILDVDELLKDISRGESIELKPVYRKA